jgi:DNA-binding transcriptional LysR family regulator
MGLSPRMPDLKALEVLLAVADHGSLNATAREVGLTQQAVSARIASLEAQSGVKLVIRGPHGVAADRFRAGRRPVGQSAPAGCP